MPADPSAVKAHERSRRGPRSSPPEGFDGPVRSDAEFGRPGAARRRCHEFTIAARRSSVADSCAKLTSMHLPAAIVDVDRVSSRQASPARLIPPVVEPPSRKAKFRSISGRNRLPPVREPSPRPAGPYRDTRPSGRTSVARHAGAVPAVLGSGRCATRVRRDGCRADIAADALRQPVDGEWRPEPPEHMVAAQPPTPMSKNIGLTGVAVEVVVDPENPSTSNPVHGERCIAEERPTIGRG